ncbi:MAG: helix-turn-helix domain-containing protein [Burkholderiaceae bacterium]|jgi:AraC-like DNA-binding protein
MSLNPSTLPMPSSYFMLVLREWGSTFELRQMLLDGVTDTDVRTIDVAQQVRQLRVLNKLLPAGWGLKLGSLFDGTTHGPVGTATLSAPTLADALEAIVRFGHVRTPFMRFALKRNQRCARLHFLDSDCLTDAETHPLHEATLVGVQSLLKHFFFSDFEGVTVEIDRTCPGYADSYRQYLKGRIEFDCAETGISFDLALLEKRSPFGDFDQFRAAILLLQTLAQALDSDDPLIWRIRQIVALSSEVPSLTAVAKQLHLSDRTLVRHLGKQNTSYRAIVDAHRRGRAEALLCQDAIPTAEIGYRLGYSDLANFGRSCRRWFGMSPKQYRKSTRQHTG